MSRSFVKNVTSRVSGFLPTGITKWFSSPSSSSANGSAAIADGTDSSTEDEAPENPIMLQPPAKRLRYSSPVGKYSQLTTSETTFTSSVTTEAASVPYNSIQTTPGRHTRREPNIISTPVRVHTEDTMNMDSRMEKSERENPFKQHTVSAIGHSIALKRQSLFDSQRQKEQSLIARAKTAAQQVVDVKQPYFKPHLLGSPFYPGRTMYGGASASSSYVNQPNIKQRKMTYVNESNNADNVSMSTSSRRIMDLLENYSSPLIEAKRIPRYELSELGNINSSMQPSTTRRHCKY
ncbi:Uncharacterized protein OBRU01_07525 [Operophtera brumata]|uniref:Nucleoporin Nup153 N-terminal domain-containing protein n=1 Tax=Operophtera brumata TaxID=104452 RepID=A0A0L7LIZ8_OPEBR|nr:Uncharacterized protein OBRU01_07525 [Operophtera brumata]